MDHPHHGQQQQQPPQQQHRGEYEEYRLKSTTAANVSHNVMILHSQTASFADFTPPVRLIRDRQYDSEEEGEGEGDGGSRPKKVEPVQAGRGRRKRTRILYLEDEDAIALREQESAPWLLEDFDGQHAFNGRLEGGQHGNYVFFVNQGNEFRVLPISRWYRFAPKLAFQPMTLEEAEAQMAKGNKDGPMVRNASACRDGAAAPVRKLESLLRPSQPASARPGPVAAKRSRPAEDQEDLDFEELFDDDDDGPGGGGGFEDADEAVAQPQPAKRPVTTLHGKQVKKLVRTLDRKLGALTGVGDDEDEEEEELDPYADEDDVEEIGDLIAKPAVNTSQTSVQTLSLSQSQQPLSGRQAHQPMRPQPAPSSQPSQLSQPQSLSQPRAPSRTISPALSTASSSAPVLSPGPAITEEDVAAVLHGQPMRTKELIARLKPKLKADPGNKDVLRELIKRMAMMRPGAPGDEEKLLELKPEYR